jgi:hypothetical protein
LSEDNTALFDDRFRSRVEIDADGTLVLQSRRGRFGDKISFWTLEAWKRGLVCDLECFGLGKPDPDFSVALGFRQCPAASEQMLREFVSSALVSLPTVAECVASRTDCQHNNKSVAFVGSDLEKTLEIVFSALNAHEISPAAQPQTVQTKLKLHQLQALEWMLRKELFRDKIPPFWQERNRYGPLPWSTDNAREWGTKHLAMTRTFLVSKERKKKDCCI